MATGKTTTLTFRIEPVLKEGQRAAAAQEHRSVANMIALMIRDYCTRSGITILEQDAFDRGRTSAKDEKRAKA